MPAIVYFNGRPGVRARTPDSVSIVLPCCRAVFAHVQQISSLGAAQGVPVGPGGIRRGQGEAVIFMIGGAYRVYIIDAFFASDDAALLVGLILPYEGELASSQELFVVEVRVPSANRRLDDGHIGFVRLLGGLAQELVAARHGDSRQHA